MKGEGESYLAAWREIFNDQVLMIKLGTVARKEVNWGRRSWVGFVGFFWQDDGRKPRMKTRIEHG